jgi:hypothetical protein
MKGGAVAAATTTTTLRFFPTRKNKERESHPGAEEASSPPDRQTDRRVASHPSLGFENLLENFYLFFVFVQIKRIYYFKTLHHITIIIFLNYIYIKVILTCHV